MHRTGFREAIRDFVRENANPPEKFSHQARLHWLATELGWEEGRPFDDDVLFAAAWLHDLGVFVGHRPEDPQALAGWDHIAYALQQTPDILRRVGFPADKIPVVLEAIHDHMPSSNPSTYEGVLLRDADILEQLGAVGILRTVSKTGRDTRFVLFSDALRVLHKNLEQLPRALRLAAARKRAESRVKVLDDFLRAAEAETGGITW